jgi:hypothetical protein
MKTTITTPKIALLFLFIYLPSLLFSQISDQFSDGNLNLNPTWSGDTTHFMINSINQLQLNAPNAGTSCIYTTTEWDSTEKEWLINVHLPFSPSSNNCCQFILKSNQADFIQMNQGFYLQMGENLSLDAIELFFKNNTQLISICRGSNSLIASSVDLNIKVTYSNQGEWKVYVDTNKSGDYWLDAQGYFPDTISMKSMGVVCKYTSSNLNKFYFDDIYYGSPIIDTSAPDIIFIKSDDYRNKIKITFSEHVNPATALKKENYIIDNLIFPDSIYWNNDIENCLTLFFNTPFPNQYSGLLVVQNISDFSGNIMDLYETSVYFNTLEKYDILFSEIMADPTPQILLPPAEYIEVFNRSYPDTAFLEGWFLKIGNTIKPLPDIKIPFQEYALIVPDSYLIEFQSLCDHVYGISSLSLTNDGQELTLMNAQNEVIHHIHYSVNWHSDPLKMDGGWSLEMIDPENPCTGADNWGSSESNLGGTPGLENSIKKENLDFHIPEIEKVIVNDSITLYVYCSESITCENIPFQIDHEVRIAKIDLLPPANQVIKLELFDPILDNTTYQLTVIDTIKDCCGNILSIGSSVLFAIPLEPSKGDIVINEILTDSFLDSDADYIELYNRSDKIIDVGKMRLGCGNTNNPEKLVMISGTSLLLFPKQYLAVCKNKKITQNQYYTPTEKSLIETDSLPNFTNSTGTIYLTDYSLNLLDYITYSTSMHSPYLNSYDGVSLEKIDFNLDSQNQDYWQSASFSVGYGTPGYQNSSFAPIKMTEDEIIIEPKIFSPNGDGYQDFTQIYTRFSDSETRITIAIYDIDGNCVKNITNNSIASQNEIYIWNGYNEIGEKLSDGIYVVYIEIWRLNGKIQKYKKAVSILH